MSKKSKRLPRGWDHWPKAPREPGMRRIWEQVLPHMHRLDAMLPYDAPEIPYDAPLRIAQVLYDDPYPKSRITYDDVERVFASLYTDSGGDLAMENPVSISSEEKESLAFTIGSLAAFVFGMRRLAGGIAIVSGVRAYQRGHMVQAATTGAIGGAFLLFPEWPENVVSALRGDTNARVLPPANLPAPTPLPDSGNFRRVQIAQDELLDGNWTMLDMSDSQTAAIAAAARSLQPGAVASLVLQQPSAPPLVFNAKVIASDKKFSDPQAPIRYSAQWASKPPVGGPQMIEFGPQHVFAIH